MTLHRTWSRRSLRAPVRRTAEGLSKPSHPGSLPAPYDNPGGPLTAYALPTGARIAIFKPTVGFNGRGDLQKWVKKAADVRRGELLDSAQALFFFKGYEATTVADIMEQAGVSKGGFYHHFTAKDDLLEALGERLAGETVDRLQPIMDQEGLDAVARMNAVLALARQLKVADAPATHAAFDSVFKPKNIVLYHRLNRAVGKVMLPIFIEILKQGKAEGRFRIDDPATTAEIVLHLGTSTYDAVARAIDASDTAHAAEAIAALDQRLRQQGIAIDRILGLADGTILFVEPDFAKAIFAGRRTPQSVPA